jgi:branched-chain amino acid transport system ATP-binding protein
VEHDMKLIMSVCHRIVAINFGIKLAEGTPEEIRNNKDVIKAYLGD